MFSATTKEAANATVNDAKSTLYNAKHDIGEAGEEVKDDLAHIANKAGRKVRDFVDTTGEQLNVAGDKIAQDIRSNPIRSSAIALGAGFVLGMLFRR